MISVAPDSPNVLIGPFSLLSCFEPLTYPLAQPPKNTILIIDKMSGIGINIIDNTTKYQAHLTFLVHLYQTLTD